MKATTVLYAALAVAGAAAAVLVPVAMYRSGSPASPVWRTAASPGPLSAVHAFLNTRCESCHTPDRGVEVATCLSCHTFAPELLAKPNTAFHAALGTCAACHLEHQGGDRPTLMDHRALVAAGAAHAPTADARGSLAALERLLDEASATLRPPGAPLPAEQAGHLDCATCHAAEDPHTGRFGATCQSCHNTATWAVASWRHPSPRSTDCAQCHQPPPSHSAEHFLSRAQRVATKRPTRVEQCYLCHQTNSFHSFPTIGQSGPR